MEEALFKAAEVFSAVLAWRLHETKEVPGTRVCEHNLIY